MKKFINFMSMVLLLFMMLINLISCANNQNQSNSIINALADEETRGDDKMTIIATLFPQYDFTKQIVKDKANVILLLPPGVESHSFEPSPKDIIQIYDSDLFIYTGEYMEIWAHKIVEESAAKGSPVVVDVSSGIPLTKTEEEHDHEAEEEHEAEHSHLYDPHIWTDPLIAIKMVDNILVGLCEKDPANASYYENNAKSYKQELYSLDDKFRKIVDEGYHKEVFFGGRFALYYFIKEYNLSYECAYANCSEETEPSAQDIAHIIDEMKEKKIPVIYYEELTDPKVAKTISEQTGAEMLLFHSAHNISKNDFEVGVTYLDLMNKNAENLKEGLKSWKN